MCSMKLFRVAALFLIAATFVVFASPAAAVANDTCRLLPIGDEPNATGVAKSGPTLVFVPDWGGGHYEKGLSVSVSCKGLTPGQICWVDNRGNKFTADEKGAGSGGYLLYGWNLPSGSFDVTVRREVHGVDQYGQETVTLVPVLAGVLVNR